MVSESVEVIEDHVGVVIAVLTNDFLPHGDARLHQFSNFQVINHPNRRRDQYLLLEIGESTFDQAIPICINYRKPVVIEQFMISERLKLMQI